MSKVNVSVIVPVHELNDFTTNSLFNALLSIKTQKVQPEEIVIVTPENETKTIIKSILEKVNFEEHESSVNIVNNKGESDFCNQVNLGITNATSEWISILEYDDEYSNIWFKAFNEYVNAHSNTDIFLPLVVDVDSNGTFIGFTNEAVWAISFSDEFGILDLNSLLTYQNFSIDGAIMRKSLIESYGGFKPSLKLTFVYEFLLRMAFNDVRIMTIPRFGYKHVNQRNGSLFDSYKNTMDPVESKWWLAQAKKEYYFDKDRGITYQNVN